MFKTASTQSRRREGATARRLFLFGVVIAVTVSLATVTTQSPPTRIVSLVPAATEMLFAIGAGPRVVAVSSYDHEPPEVDRLPRDG